MSSLVGLHPYTLSRQLRSASLNHLSQPLINITLASRGFRHAGPSLWNSLPRHLRSNDSYTVFKYKLKTLVIAISAYEDTRQGASDKRLPRRLPHVNPALSPPPRAVTQSTSYSIQTASLKQLTSRVLLDREIDPDYWLPMITYIAFRFPGLNRACA